MKQLMYVVYDTVACEVMRLNERMHIFLANNDGHALRTFRQVQDSLKNYAGEVKLYCIGSIDLNAVKCGAFDPPVVVDLNLDNAEEVLDG